MKTKKTKYAICPGYIRSKTDGDRHYIGYNRLIELYQLNPKDCFLDEKVNYIGLSPSDQIIYIYPLYSGNYQIFRKNETDVD